MQEVLQAFPLAKAKSALETMEHLALLKRWYYRSSRSGEIFFADDKGELPMRRVVRGNFKSVPRRETGSGSFFFFAVELTLRQAKESGGH